MSQPVGGEGLINLLAWFDSTMGYHIELLGNPLPQALKVVVSPEVRRGGEATTETTVTIYRIGTVRGR